MGYINLNIVQVWEQMWERFLFFAKNANKINEL